MRINEEPYDLEIDSDGFTTCPRCAASVSATRWELSVGELVCPECQTDFKDILFMRS